MIVSCECNWLLFHRTSFLLNRMTNKLSYSQLETWHFPESELNQSVTLQWKWLTISVSNDEPSTSKQKLELWKTYIYHQHVKTFLMRVVMSFVWYYIMKYGHSGRSVLLSEPIFPKWPMHDIKKKKIIPGWKRLV